MIKRQLRPKYTIEQYPVVFTFPGAVLGVPEITVEVVSGVDPNVETFAGLPFTFGDLVSVVVVGGLPGVVYRISCAATVADEILIQSGLVAVISTSGVVPEGTSPIPLTLTQTTPPYSAYVLDELAVLGTARTGISWQIPLDELDISSFALNGIQRELIAFYSMLPDELDVSSYTLNGTHRLLLAIYTNYPPESVDVTSYALNGTHRVILLAYLNYLPEEIDITSYALNGTHA